MAEPILSYSSVGKLADSDGYDWLFSRSVCPYCQEPLDDLGSFHRNLKVIVPLADKVLGDWICMECGRKHALLDDSRNSEELAEGVRRYFPKQITPLLGCLPNVFSCEKCGWWCAGEHSDTCNTPIITPVVGILRSFDLSSSNVPLEVLRAELPRHFDRIGTINPNRMEDVVADILKGVYDAEVQQLGYTRDGGIDLIVLRSDNPIAVQVKRRITRTSESVIAVREFLGASLLKELKHLLYVSSAKHFTNDAKDAAEKAVELGIVNSYELIAMEGLRDLINHRPTPVWLSSLRAVRENPKQIARVQDPFEYAAVR